MRKQRASASLSLPSKSDSNNDVESEEPSEDEDPSEEEPCEEELSEEEEYEEEQNEEDPSEEDPSEVSSPEGDNGEEYQPNSVLSNSGENRSSDNTVADHLQKRQKQDLYSAQGLNTGASGTGLQDKSKTLSCDELVTKKLQSTENSGKKRCSRWDTQPEADGEAVDGGDLAPKKRKSRWASDDTQSKILSSVKLPDFMKNLVGEAGFNPETNKLNAQLVEINLKLQSRKVVDDRPENERSPSPPPIYNDLGIHINTRESRLRSKLIYQKQKIISQLVQKDPTFKPPSDKSQKLFKKLYIPLKENPGCNFIGLIIGPRGNTQKKMEKETGARIHIRGRGSSKESKFQQNKDAKLDPSEDEALHVLVEADSRESLDAAVEMVKKILYPVEEEIVEHKRAQLRELAELNGTFIEEKLITLQKPTFRTGVACNVCGDGRHPTSACPLTASTPGSSTGVHQINFLGNLGGGLSPFSGPTVSSTTRPWIPNPAPCALPPKEIDDANLFVGYLPHSVNEDKLIELFSPLGNLCEVKVIKDKSTGISKGYGFVKYTDPINAVKAVAQMNGYKIDGKMLAVRVAGRPPAPVNSGLGLVGSSSFSNLPTYPGPVAIPQVNPGSISWPGPPGSTSFSNLPAYPGPVAIPQVNSGSISWPGPPGSTSFSNLPTYPGPVAIPQVHPGSMSWPGPPGSVLPEQYASSASIGSSSQTPVVSSLISHDVTLSRELAQFPGYLNSLNPQHQSYQSTGLSSLSSSQFHLTRDLGSHQIPPR